ncbi:2'-5' RNA ligase family protein [Adhaeribacter radiodurans]|uniref:2'-5' RNA ligase family protein n=1 Tax=Adhaeribacter radiodurans TaxID=2745197 RepID=A0A7L7LA37_9BACT|nr:2'-5' RNA ligase family protein [Adhaeribacter radiodurans]QMU29613.1 2'-5' RNA ligase family protein [Adhaeribacter radiodurans]
MIQPAPLILTLQIDEQAFNYFNDLRKQHFPPQINYLSTHVTLFHHLPAHSTVTDLLEEATAQQKNFPVKVSEVIKLGRGVGFKLQSEELAQLHAYLKKQWSEWLTPQDRQGFRPHITVQNKVTPEVAQTLFNQLAFSFQPFYLQGIGLSLWEYLGGPWQKVKDYSFKVGTY